MLVPDMALGRFAQLFEVCPVTVCWLWTAGRSLGGGRWSEKAWYGSFWVDSGLNTLRAHVFSAWAFGIIPGPRVPPGMNLDHLCRRSLCVSPWHLELVPKLVNQQRKLQTGLALPTMGAAL